MADSWWEQDLKDREERKRQEKQRQREQQEKLFKYYDFDEVARSRCEQAGGVGPWPLTYVLPTRWDYGNPDYSVTDSRHWQEFENVTRCYINELHEMIKDLRDELQELREELTGE